MKIHHMNKTEKMIFSFCLLVMVAGFLSLFIKPSITGGVVVNDELTEENISSLSLYLFAALIFCVIYVVYPYPNRIKTNKNENKNSTKHTVSR